MKLSASIVALGLTACQDLAMTMGGGSDDGGMPQMGDPDDPRDDPYLGDINNAWGGPLRGGFLGFTFFSTPSGKSSSSVVTGGSDSFQVDGIFYDHTVHLTVMEGANVMTLDGVFIDIETMDLTIQETQARIVLHCSTQGGVCK
jgi:hypothetical protein